jgi:hypothetical protein
MQEQARPQIDGDEPVRSSFPCSRQFPLLPSPGPRGSTPAAGQPGRMTAVAGPMAWAWSTPLRGGSLAVPTMLVRRGTAARGDPQGGPRGSTPAVGQPGRMTAVAGPMAWAWSTPLRGGSLAVPTMLVRRGTAARGDSQAGPRGSTPAAGQPGRMTAVAGPMAWAWSTPLRGGSLAVPTMLVRRGTAARGDPQAGPRGSTPAAGQPGCTAAVASPMA